MKGLLSRAGRKPRPTYPDPKEILLGQLSDEQLGWLQTTGCFEVRGATTSNVYRVREDGVVVGFCVTLDDEWYGDDADDIDYDYAEYAKVLAVKQLIESDEALFLRVANSDDTTREVTGAEAES